MGQGVLIIRKFLAARIIAEQEQLPYSPDLILFFFFLLAEGNHQEDSS